MKKQNQLRAMVFAAVLAALSAVLGLFAGFRIGDVYKFGFSKLPVVYASLTLGPLWGAFVGLVGDILGAIPYGWNPFLSIPAILIGVLPWCVVKIFGEKKNIFTVVLGTMFTRIIMSGVVQTALLGYFYEWFDPMSKFWTMFTVRIITAVIESAVEGLVVFYMLKIKPLNKILSKYLEKNTKQPSFRKKLTVIASITLVISFAIGGVCLMLKPKTTKIRVMSFNIQAELWGGPPIEGREEKLNTLLETNLPDVAGLQEVTAPWYDYLSKYEGEKYCFVDKVNENGDTNYSPLIYNKDTTELLKHGTKIYSRGNDPKLRLLSWGLFKNKETGSKFIVTSTHWDIGSNADMITVQAAEMGKWVKELHSKYGVPVISTGDYNRKVTSDQFKNFVSICGFIDANTSPVISEKDKNAETIDHIMASSDVEFIEYKILRDEFSASISDHKPMYADITIWP